MPLSDHLYESTKQIEFKNPTISNSFNYKTNPTSITLNGEFLSDIYSILICEKEIVVNPSTSPVAGTCSYYDEIINPPQSKVPEKIECPVPKQTDKGNPSKVCAISFRTKSLEKINALQTYNYNGYEVVSVTPSILQRNIQPTTPTTPPIVPVSKNIIVKVQSQDPIPVVTSFSVEFKHAINTGILDCTSQTIKSISGNSMEISCTKENQQPIGQYQVEVTINGIKSMNFGDFENQKISCLNFDGKAVSWWFIYITKVQVSPGIYSYLYIDDTMDEMIERSTDNILEGSAIGRTTNQYLHYHYGIYDDEKSVRAHAKGHYIFDVINQSPVGIHVPHSLPFHGNINALRTKLMTLSQGLNQHFFCYEFSSLYDIIENLARNFVSMVGFDTLPKGTCNTNGNSCWIYHNQIDYEVMSKSIKKTCIDSIKSKYQSRDTLLKASGATGTAYKAFLTSGDISGLTALNPTDNLENICYWKKTMYVQGKNPLYLDIYSKTTITLSTINKILLPNKVINPQNHPDRSHPALPWEIVINPKSQKYEGIDLWEVIASYYYRRKMFAGIHITGQTMSYPTGSLALVASYHFPEDYDNSRGSGTAGPNTKFYITGNGNDHSKLAYSMYPKFGDKYSDDNENIFCLGDSNRHNGQAQRGGGVYCFQHPTLVLQFNRFIRSYSTMNKNKLAHIFAPDTSRNDNYDICPMIYHSTVAHNLDINTDFKTQFELRDGDNIPFYPKKKVECQNQCTEKVTISGVKRTSLDPNAKEEIILLKPYVANLWGIPEPEISNDIASRTMKMNYVCKHEVGSIRDEFSINDKDYRKTFIETEGSPVPVNAFQPSSGVINILDIKKFYEINPGSKWVYKMKKTVATVTPDAIITSNTGPGPIQIIVEKITPFAEYDVLLGKKSNQVQKRTTITTQFSRVITQVEYELISQIIKNNNIMLYTNGILQIPTVDEKNSAQKIIRHIYGTSGFYSYKFNHLSADYISSPTDYLLMENVYKIKTNLVTKNWIVDPIDFNFIFNVEEVIESHTPKIVYPNIHLSYFDQPIEAESLFYVMLLRVLINSNPQKSVFELTNVNWANGVVLGLSRAIDTDTVSSLFNGIDINDPEKIPKEDSGLEPLLLDFYKSAHTIYRWLKLKPNHENIIKETIVQQFGTKNFKEFRDTLIFMDSTFGDKEHDAIYARFYPPPPPPVKQQASSNLLKSKSKASNEQTQPQTIQNALESLLVNPYSLSTNDLLSLAPNEMAVFEESIDKWMTFDNNSMAIQVLLKETMIGLSDLEIKYLEDVNQNTPFNLCPYDNTIRFYYQVCNPMTIPTITNILEMMMSDPTSIVYTFSDLIVYYIATPIGYQPQFQDLPMIDFDGFAVITMNSFICDISLIYQHQLEISQISSINLCKLGKSIITGIFPNHGPSNGTQILVSGLYFEESSTIDIGGVPCQIQSQTSNQIICTAIGVGKKNIITISNQFDQDTKFYFSFDSPVMESISPLTIPNNFNGEILIHGKNFGTNVLDVSVYFDDYECLVTRVSDIQINCNTSSSIGTIFSNIFIKVKDQTTGFDYTSLSNSIAQFTPPELLSIVGDKYASWLDQIALLGNQFDNQPSLSKIFIGDQQNDILGVDNDQIIISISSQIPPLNNSSLTLNIGNYQIKGNSSQLISYTKAYGTIIQNSNIPTSGGYIQIIGDGWGFLNSEISLQISQRNLECNTFEVYLECFVPPGIGKGLVISGNASRQSIELSNSISYAPPNILSVIAYGSIVSITGENFVPAGLSIDSTTFIEILSKQNVSSRPSVIQFKDSSTIEFELSDFDIQSITVSIAGQTSTFTLNYISVYGFVSTVNNIKLSNVEITLYNSVYSYSTSSNSEGEYKFGWNVLPGIYQISLSNIDPNIYGNDFIGQVSVSSVNPLEYNIYISSKNEKGCRTTLTSSSGSIIIGYGVYELSDYDICLDQSICENPITSQTTEQGCTIITNYQNNPNSIQIKYFYTLDLSFYIDSTFDGIPTNYIPDISKFDVSIETKLANGNPLFRPFKADSNGKLKIDTTQGNSIVKIILSNGIYSIVNNISLFVNGSTPIISYSFGLFESGYLVSNLYDSQGSYLSLPLGIFSPGFISNIGWLNRIRSYSLPSDNFILYIQKSGGYYTINGNQGSITIEENTGIEIINPTTITPNLPSISSGGDKFSFTNQYTYIIPQFKFLSTNKQINCVVNVSSIACTTPLLLSSEYPSTTSTPITMFWKGLPSFYKFPITLVYPEIKGRVYNDSNLNNKYDSGETIITSIVTLFPGSSQTTQNYLFTRVEYNQIYQLNASASNYLFPFSYLSLNPSVDGGKYGSVSRDIPAMYINTFGCTSTLRSSTSQLNLQYGTYNLLDYGFCMAPSICQNVVIFNSSTLCINSFSGNTLTVKFKYTLDLFFYLDNEILGSSLGKTAMDPSKFKVTILNVEYTADSSGKIVFTIPVTTGTISITTTDSAYYSIKNQIPFNFGTNTLLSLSFGLYKCSYCTSPYSPVIFYSSTSEYLSLPIGKYNYNTLSGLGWVSKTTRFKSNTNVNVFISTDDTGTNVASLASTGDVTLPANQISYQLEVSDIYLFSTISSISQLGQLVTITNRYQSITSISIDTVYSTVSTICYLNQLKTQIICNLPSKSSSFTLYLTINNNKIYQKYLITVTDTIVQGYLYADTNRDNQITSGEGGFFNVVVTMGSYTATTNEYGNFKFTNLARVNTEYTISVPSQSGYVFGLQSVKIKMDSNSGTTININFSAQPDYGYGCYATLLASTGQAFNMLYTTSRGYYYLPYFGLCKDSSCTSSISSVKSLTNGCKLVYDGNFVSLTYLYSLSLRFSLDNRIDGYTTSIDPPYNSFYFNAYTKFNGADINYQWYPNSHSFTFDIPGDTTIYIRPTDNKLYSMFDRIYISASSSNPSPSANILLYLYYFGNSFYYEGSTTYVIPNPLPPYKIFEDINQAGQILTLPLGKYNYDFLSRIGWAYRISSIYRQSYSVNIYLYSTIYDDSQFPLGNVINNINVPSEYNDKTVQIEIAQANLLSFGSSTYSRIFSMSMGNPYPAEPFQLYFRDYPSYTWICTGGANPEWMTCQLPGTIGGGTYTIKSKWKGLYLRDSYDIKIA